MQFSETTIKRVRKKLGWVKTGPKYCQLVREKNRVDWLDLCKNVHASGDDFENVIFMENDNMENYVSERLVKIVSYFSAALI